MQAIHADNVNWKSQSRGVREAKVYSKYHGSEETRIDIVEVPSGGYIPPHRHSSRREFITILLSAGAQLQIGDRVFRPIAGQVFHREPEDILALTNDSHHPFRYSVVRFGYEASDIEWINEEDAVLLEDQKAAHVAAQEARKVAQNKPEVEVEDEPKAAEEVVTEEKAPQDEDETSEPKEKTSKKATKKSESSKSEKKPKKGAKSEKSGKSDKKKKEKKPKKKKK